MKKDTIPPLIGVCQYPSVPRPWHEITHEITHATYSAQILNLSKELDLAMQRLIKLCAK